MSSSRYCRRVTADEAPPAHASCSATVQTRLANAQSSRPAGSASAGATNDHRFQFTWVTQGRAVRTRRCFLEPRGPTPASVTFQWYHLRPFGHFVAETRSVQGLADLDRALLVRYIEWLGQQRTAAGKAWSKSTRSVTYTALRKLLQWLGTLSAWAYQADRLSVQPISGATSRYATS
jgi:hypothetical protein